MLMAILFSTYNIQLPALQGVETGPRLEIAYWQSRLALLSHLSDNLRRKEFAIVIGVPSASRCKEYNQWRVMEAKVCPP